MLEMIKVGMSIISKHGSDLIVLTEAAAAIQGFMVLE